MPCFGLAVLAGPGRRHAERGDDCYAMAGVLCWFGGDGREGKASAILWLDGQGKLGVRIDIYMTKITEKYEVPCTCTCILQKFINT